MSEPKSKNITWHHGLVDRKEREKVNRNRGVILWYTGLSGSGKSTIANALEKRVFDAGIIPMFWTAITSASA